MLADLGIAVEVVNQARVHLWYEADFGKPYAALGSTRDGIERFLVTSTCVGVHSDALYAACGLQALYRGELAMNPLVPHRELFDAKVESYRARWPALRVVAEPARAAQSESSDVPLELDDQDRMSNRRQSDHRLVLAHFLNRHQQRFVHGFEKLDPALEFGGGERAGQWWQVVG